jgi:hypothetical protein
MKPLFGLIATLALAVVLCLGVGCDSCEQKTPPPQGPGQAPGSPQEGEPGSTRSQQPQISDADLKKVAVANVAIAEITQEWQQSMQKTQSADERQQLQVGAYQRMMQAIADAGIDVQTYNVIMEQVRTDEELLKKFMAFEEKAKK